MTPEQFEQVVTRQMKTCTDVLVVKAREYADDVDRLHNFKVAAALEGISVREALAGMMAKHSVSIYDMCSSEAAYTVDIWNEKITDHINYLILLRAVIEEAHSDPSQDMLPHVSY